jgi:hypothetical protein
MAAAHNIIAAAAISLGNQRWDGRGHRGLTPRWGQAFDAEAIDPEQYAAALGKRR